MTVPMPSENDRQAQARQTWAGQPQGRRIQARRAQVTPAHATPAQAEQVQALWRARALRYVMIYLLMGGVLVTLRYQTREIYPQLYDLRITRTELQRQQKELSLTVQSLTGEQRVRDWAIANGMMPYAQATKQTQVFGPPVAPLGPASATAQSESPPQPGLPASQRPAPNPITVRTVWK